MGPKLVKIIGIYHADSGLVGHLRYALAKMTGRAGCALCDVTHGTVREKGAFADCKGRFDAPMELIYRDQLTPDLAEVTDGSTPAVVGVFAQGPPRPLLGPAELAALQGDVDAFQAALEAALSRTLAPDQ